MPTIWPYELSVRVFSEFSLKFQDIKETILNADTIVYMAEFFSECLNKMKLRLGPTTPTVSKIDAYLRSENLTVYHHILENAFDESSSIDINVDKDLDHFMDMFNVIKYYYGCSSLAYVGELHLHNSSVEKKLDVIFDIVSANCPNVERL